MLEDAQDVGGEAAVGTTPEVGHVDCDPAPGLEDPDALGEDIGEHLEVLEVGGGDPLGLELLLVGLPGEVGRRCDDEGHASVGDGRQVASVTAEEGLGDLRWRRDLPVVGELGRPESLVEAGGVVGLALGDPEARGGGAAARAHGLLSSGLTTRTLALRAALSLDDKSAMEVGAWVGGESLGAARRAEAVLDTVVDDPSGGRGEIHVHPADGVDHEGGCGRRASA